MKGIIIAYPIRSTALQLKSLFEEEGLYVSHICSTGASVLNIATELRGGVIVCTSVLADMTSALIAENLPPNFDVVAITKGGREIYSSNYITLPLPINRIELVEIVSTLASSDTSFTKRANGEDEYISNAKSILMSVRGISEMQAHKYLQEESMRSGKKLVDIAKEVIDNMIG